ncbi:MAG: hypothetical protein GY830_02480 [Bacteroidetes bacterium]|nr:hypothetical protein [Bacteroidota bacterium]
MKLLKKNYIILKKIKLKDNKEMKALKLLTTLRAGLKEYFTINKNKDKNEKNAISKYFSAFINQ